MNVADNITRPIGGRDDRYPRLARQLARRARMPTRSQLAVAFAWPALIYLCGFSLFRSFDVAPVLIVLVCSALASFFAAHLTFGRAYVAYSCWATLLMALSLLHLMPRGWTVHFELFAALRHYVVYLALPFLISSFLILIQRYENLIFRHALLLFLGFTAATRLSIYLGKYEDQSLSLYIFSNENAIVAMLFCVVLFHRWRPVVQDIVLIALFMLVCTSMQSQLFGVALLGIRILRKPRLVLFGVLAATSIFLIVAPFFVHQLHGLDHNTGVRALLWSHAVEAVAQTWGLGVGFGTEYIKNDFSEILYRGWTFVGAGDELYVGTHSAYFDIFLRTGVIGLLLLLCWFWPALNVPKGSNILDQRLGAAIATIVCITASVDMALTSLNYLFGCALGLAILHRIRFGTLFKNGAPAAPGPAIGPGAIGGPRTTRSGVEI